MLHPFKLLLAIAVVAGFASVPTMSYAENAKSGSASQAKKSPATDEFEENRRAHMEKSKENNANKGAN